MKKIIKMNEIIITDNFKKYTPNILKIIECEKVWNKFGVQDRYIVINDKNELIDGYVQYLVLDKNNIKNAEVVISNIKMKRYRRINLSHLTKEENKPFAYVYGVHPKDSSKKEYCWFIPKKWGDFARNLKVNDMVWVKTKNGTSPVTITKIVFDIENHGYKPLRQVASKKIIIRVGE